MYKICVTPHSNILTFPKPTFLFHIIYERKNKKEWYGLRSTTCPDYLM